VRVVLYTASGAADDFRSVATSIEALTDDVAQPTIQPVPDAWREAEWIAGEVKKLIVQEAVEPHDIAIVARTGLEDTRRTLQVLRSAGIPATARVRAPLVEIGAIKAILVLFRASAEDWSYPNLRRVLTSPYFKTRVDVRTIDRIAQEARPHSLAGWVDELARVIARDTADAAAQEDEDRKAGIERRVQRYRDTVPQLDALIPTLARVDGERTLVQWIELTRELLVDGWLDLRRRICRPPMERNDVVRFDQRAVRQLEKMLQQWISVANDDVLAPDQWYALLRTLLAGQELALTTPGQKGVQILEAHDAALIPFHATFLLHANDGVFPRLPAAGGLFAEEEKATLQAAGMPIDTFDSAFQREGALWAAVTCGDHVTITYRTTDPKGTPLLPSLLVPAHDESRELARTADLVSEPLNAAQETYQDACALGVVTRNGEEPRRIVTADADAMRHLILQARAEQLRGAPDRSFLEQPLNPWNGVIRDARVLDHLEREYGPEHWWSASQLETYAKCPFIYLIQRVLRVEEAEEADEETNALTSGGVAHDILELFYATIKDRLPVDVDTATTTFIQAARQVFHQRETSGEWLGVPVLWEQRKHWLCETLVSFIAWDIEKLGRDRPAWCEYVTKVAKLNGKDAKGRPVGMLLRGRIDRIDRLAKGGYRVVDYKTSYVPSKGHYCDGGALQGAVYIDALIQEGIDANCSVYKSLKNCNNGAPLTVGHPEYATALGIAYSIPARARAGLFEVNLAASQKWASWQPDASVTRNRAKLEKGASRFE
jgi:ATP-dependent helicase/DNAse subunit B